MVKKFAAAMMAGALVLSAGTMSDVSAKKLNGWVKAKGVWSYYVKGKKSTGLKKIKGQQYYFNKKGKMQTGLQTIGNKVYYFKKAKNGKAPLQKGKIFWSVGNKKGNTAISDALIKSGYNFSKSKTKNLKTVYDWLMKKMKYAGLSFQPNFNKNGWYNNVAYEVVKENDYGGKCWDYAAMTTLAAKAIGFNRDGYQTYAVNGTQNLNNTQFTLHAYTIIKDPTGAEYILDGVFDDSQGYNAASPRYYYERYVNVSGNYYKMEKETGVSVDTNGQYVLPTEKTDTNSFVYQEAGRK